MRCLFHSLGKQNSLFQRFQGELRKLEHEPMIREEKGREWLGDRMLSETKFWQYACVLS